MTKQPEDIWGVDDDFVDSYAEHVRIGRECASNLSVIVVGIARTAMPYLQNTLELLDELRLGFRDFQAYIYENDSADSTPQVLDAFAAGHPWLHVRHDTLGGADERGFHPERTARLARCRNECHDYVRRHAAGTTLTIVIDLDPHHGFSVDGVFSSVYWLMRYQDAGGMASYSLWSQRAGDGRKRNVAHYDAWAARPISWWRDLRGAIGFAWFSAFMPPVGAPPQPMNSAFGGLCVYRTEAFLGAGKDPYEGGDCEHVALHRKLAKTGWKFYLNPGCRYVALWD